MLGSGASGTVWAAKNELIDREVALKILHPDVATDSVQLQRFFNEAKASGRVHSPNIAEILDLGQAEDGSPFLVFELLHGEGLDTWIARERTLDPRNLTELMIGVVRALELAHAQGIIHRDLKPANLYAHRGPTGQQVLKILDFGISKMVEGNTAEHMTLTRTGTVVGSPAYMSPEQAAGREDIDGRADVWSLGVVLYEALTGTLPHEAPNYNALMVRIMTRDADPALSRRPDLPPTLATLIDDCLKRERERRPMTPALAARLEAALLEMQPVARQVVPTGPHPIAPAAAPVPVSQRAPNPAAHAHTTVSQRYSFNPGAVGADPWSGKFVLAIAAGVGIALGLVALVVLSKFLLR